MGIKRLSGDTNIAKNEAYRYLRHAPTFIIIGIISHFLAHIIYYFGMISLVFHHLYVFSALTVASVFYSIVINLLFWPSMMIAVDLKQPFWRAMILSVRIICRYFWPGAKIFVCWVLINLAGLLLAGIGLFWTIPWSFLAAAKFYADIKADLAALIDD